MKENEEKKSINQSAASDNTNDVNSPSSTREPFFTVPSKVFDYGLNPYELTVLIYLLMRSDNQTHACYPSERTISKECGMSLATVKRGVRSLEEKDLIKVEKQYSKSKNGNNRQTANLYTVKLREIPHEVLTEPPPSSVGHPPQLTEIREINKTISIITTPNITKSTELSMSEAEEILRERNMFLTLKRDCLEKLKSEYKIETDYILLIDRALEHLWSRKSIEYEGREYKKDELQAILSKNLVASALAYSKQSFEGVREPIHSPVAYLAKCILGAILHPVSAFVPTDKQVPTNALKDAHSASDPPSEDAENGFDPTLNVYKKGFDGAKKSTAAPPRQNGSTFDLDDFFAAALDRAYNMD